MYGTKHKLALGRTDDTDSMIRNSRKKADGSDETKPGKINLTKLSWRMPILKLSDEYSAELISDIKGKQILLVDFLSRQCESLKLNNNQRNFDWKLCFSTGSERSRYVILGFQKSRFSNYHKNSSEFDNLNVRNTYIEFNGERYPD